METLANKYRPHLLEEVIGQETVIKILQMQLENKAFKNSYIFWGASGDGKTTTARAFANAINKGIGSPIEIDAASNNGVDNVRSIIEDAQERSLDSKYKIYIIDEAHMITTAGWNAFLKCIEEPPQYTIFIFCTTDVHKIPDTIRNRCQSYHFSRISSSNIRDRLMYICNQEGFFNCEDTCDYISKICKGQMRDAITYLDKCSDFSKDLNLDLILPLLGEVSYDDMFELVNGMVDGNVGKVLEVVDNYYNRGNDLILFIDQYLKFLLDLAKYVIFQNMEVTSLPKNKEEAVRYSVGIENSSQYFGWLIDKILALKNMLKWDLNPKGTVEASFLGICSHI